MAEQGLVRTYSPLNVSASLGIHTIKGYGETSMIRFIPDAATYTRKKSADGSETRIRTPDGDKGVIEINLMSTSPSNQALLLLHETDKRLNITYPFILRDLSSGIETFNGSNCYIEGYPTIAYTKETEERVWRILVPLILYIAGTDY